jgi:hypothetical protein
MTLIMIFVFRKTQPGKRTDSIKQRSSWEANICSDNHKFLQILGDHKVHRHVYKSLPLNPILSQMKPLNKFHPVYFKSQLKACPCQIFGAPITFHLSVCTCDVSRTTEIIFMKFGANVLPLKTTPNSYILTFYDRQYQLDRHVLMTSLEWSCTPVVLTDIIPVAALAATVGVQWPLCINHTKKAVKFKYTFQLYQYFLI